MPVAPGHVELQWGSIIYCNAIFCSAGIFEYPNLDFFAIIKKKYLDFRWRF
jgi:hypothetical protein